MCVQLPSCCQVSASQIPYELAMYGIFAYICLKFMVNVGTYSSPMDAIWVVTFRQLFFRGQKSFGAPTGAAA